MQMDEAAGPYAWLDANAVRTASDVVVGVVLLSAAAAAFAGATDLPFRSLDLPAPGFHPVVIAGLLALVCLLLLARGIVVGAAPPERWNPIALAIVATAIVAAPFAVARWGLPAAAIQVALYMGPAEYVALIVLVLAIAIALVRVSRVRAAGMVLLGLVLATVGTDVETGVERFTMGVDQLSDGIEPAAVTLGLVLLAEGLICLALPSLLLATHARRIAGWSSPSVPTLAAMAMRLAAVLAITAAAYYVFELNRSFWDVGALVVFGLFGVACKVLGWNRLVLILAFAYGRLLEEKLRQALVMSKGDFAAIMGGPSRSPCWRSPWPSLPWWPLFRSGARSCADGARATNPDGAVADNLLRINLEEGEPGQPWQIVSARGVPILNGAWHLDVHHVLRRPPCAPV
jgi:Tripartite tricarboxylate transporter TctA family